MAPVKLIFKCTGENGLEYWKYAKGSYQFIQIREGVAKAFKRAGYEIRDISEKL